MKRREAENGIFAFSCLFFDYTGVKFAPLLPRKSAEKRASRPCLRFDPHADPHGKTSGRKQWNKQAATSSLLERKVPESLAAQRIEVPKAVGKDEVGSSNLPSSSTKIP